jgi:hypothetical protein
MEQREGGIRKWREGGIRKWRLADKDKIKLMQRFARIYKSPTTGNGAAYIWYHLSGNNAIMPSPAARRFYMKLGYIPFYGFPLARLARYDWDVLRKIGGTV